MNDRQIALNVIYAHRDNTADRLVASYINNEDIEIFLASQEGWATAQGILIALLNAFGIEHEESYEFDYVALDNLIRWGYYGDAAE